MSQMLAPVLFQSETRSAVLDLLFVRGLSASVSELARRAGLSVRTVAREVKHLVPTGLVVVETVGGADVVHANTAHPGARPLRALLQTPCLEPSVAVGGDHVRESLVAWGAPLADVRGRRHYPLVETLLRGLVAARTDGTVLRVLPTVLAKNLSEVSWPDLREDARRRKLKGEVGWLVEQTAELLNRPELKHEVAALQDRRRRTCAFFPVVKSGFEEDLAKKRSPPTALRWGFWMNMSPETFRSTLERHHA